MPKIYSVVTLFDPPFQVEKNILTYFSYIDFLLIIDNSKTKFNFSNHIIGTNKIFHLHTGENIGIAKALNFAIDFSIEHNADYLLTMDQDSYFENNYFIHYKNNLLNFQVNNTVMFGVNHLKNELKKEVALDSHLKVEILITSGSIINLNKISTIGKFDENLFIDEVDNEFCYRALLNNFDLILFNNLFLNHSLGQKKVIKRFYIGKKIARVIYSPVRIFYFVRNFLYVNKRYKRQFHEHRNIVKKNILNSIKNNLFYGNHKLETLKFIIKGIIAYKNKHMGKYE